MCYLVYVDHSGMAADLTISDSEEFYEMLYVQGGGLDW
jgi:hypothetical protein